MFSRSLRRVLSRKNSAVLTVLGSERVKWILKLVLSSAQTWYILTIKYPDVQGVQVPFHISVMCLLPKI